MYVRVDVGIYIKWHSFLSVPSHDDVPCTLQYLEAVWFVAKCVTLCLRLGVRIEELTLGRKVRQSVAS
jgi:hypothetical protein